MIASNSARSSSSSASSRSRNRSSVRPALSGLSGSQVCDITITAASGVDGLLVVVVAADGDLAGLGLLRDRDPQREHTTLVAGGDVLGVEVVAQDQLPAEHPA